MTLTRNFYLPIDLMPHAGVRIDEVIYGDGNDRRFYLLGISDPVLTKTLNESIEQYQISRVWVERVERAIEHDALSLHTQVIAPLEQADNTVLPLQEILLRLSENGKVLNAGDVFVGLSNSPETLRRIDRLVLEKVCSNAVPGQVYAVNLSGASLTHFSFAEWVSRLLLLPSTKIEPKAIIFEMTEQVLLNREFAKKTIAGLSKLGCSIALDDFGAGWCCQLYFLELCEFLSHIKLDGTAIRSLPNPCARSILRANLSLAAAHGVDVIAEHVESEEVLEEIRSIAAEFPTVQVSVQGWLIGGVEPWI